MTLLGGLLRPGAPHYVREYRRLVRFLGRKGASEMEVAERAVGGSFEKGGAAQAQLVLDIAPSGPFRLIDVGCGSGRAARVLREVDRIQYLGTDVVPALLDHARKIAGRPDWRFEEVTSLVIPASDEWADIVMFFSVFTHLTAGETTAYVREAARVLKPEGSVICSYLDRTNPAHVRLFRPHWRQQIARALGRDVMITFTTEAELSGILESYGFSVERSLKQAEFGQHVLVGRRNR